MSKHLKKFIGKVFILSCSLGIVFFGISYYFVNGFEKSQSKINPNITNLQQFKWVNNSNLWSIWVAITTNLWTNHKLINELPATIYQDVMSVQEAMFDRKKARDNIIGANMIAVQEYRNVLQTSIKNLIENALNKKDVLEAYISQLEFRYTNTNNQLKKLLEQKNIFEQQMQVSNQKVESIKQKITVDFNNYDENASLENIDEYLEEKQKYYFARTYIIYINQFLREYQYLNAYNKNLLDVLINNKEAIIKDAYVIIPNNGWIEALKALDLLFDEADFKNQ